MSQTGGAPSFSQGPQTNSAGFPVGPNTGSGPGMNTAGWSPGAMGQMNSLYGNPWLGNNLYYQGQGYNLPFGGGMPGMDSWGGGGWNMPPGGGGGQAPQQPNAATFTRDVGNIMNDRGDGNITNLVKDVRGMQGMPSGGNAARSSFPGSYPTNK